MADGRDFDVVIVGAGAAGIAIHHGEDAYAERQGAHHEVADVGCPTYTAALAPAS